jgi:hypothetical protein
MDDELRNAKAEQRKELQVLERMNNPVYDEDFFAAFPPAEEAAETTAKKSLLPTEKNSF